MEWKYPLTHYVLRRLSIPIAKHLIPSTISPISITISGFILGIISAFFLAINQFIIALILLLFSLVIDVVDGEVARLRKQSTKRGAFLDSLLDRVVDSSLIFGLVISNPEYLTIPGIIVASGSIIISYIRKQADEIGIDCRVGLATRDIRILVLIIGISASLFYPQALFYSLIFLTMIIFITILQRASYTFNRIRETSTKP